MTDSTCLRKPATFQSFAKGLPTLLVLAVMACGWWIVQKVTHSVPAEAVTSDVAVESSVADTLTLPDGKLKAARFESIPAQNQSVQHIHTVPGRLRYDETKHVDVKAPMDGILAEVQVTPGQLVESGELLAVLRSPEIGRARADVLKQRKDREIADQRLKRDRTLEKNLEEMTSMLDRGQSIEAIEVAFTDRALGTYRQDILTAYSKWKLAAELLNKVQPLANSGSISGRTIREREAERQQAETAFLSARDQAKFAAMQATLKSEADVAEADRQLNLAWQAVETLLGYKEDKASAQLDDEEALSRLEVRAPFSGSVESRGFANNERVSRGDSLVVLANTQTLYVEASIRESDWSAVSLAPGTIVRVFVPALQDREFSAEVRYVGRQVQSDTNSVPLVAAIDNAENLLRPGMFVRVTVPIGNSREALSVKPAAVLQHENQKFVFVDMTGGTFKRVDVTTGQASEDWVEVTEGLTPGQLVVTGGAFLLKSEMLLQGESE